MGQAGIHACRVLSFRPQVSAAIALSTAAVTETELRRCLWTYPGADPTADAFFFPVADGSVAFPVHGTGRTLPDAFRIVTMNAGTGEMILSERIFSAVQCISAAEEQTHFQIVFVLACHLAGIAADAFLLVIDKSETIHRNSFFSWLLFVGINCIP